MNEKTSSFYWDTCIFLAFLMDEKITYGRHVNDINQFLQDAQKGRCKIYTSTITIAEIPSKRMKESKYKTFVDFLNDYSGTIIQINPDPPIMVMAAELHGAYYTKTNGKRTLETPDAIHLATAISLTDTYGVPLDEFYTFDNGGKKGIGGKALSLLTFEEWCQEQPVNKTVKRAMELVRCKPKHPEPRFLP